MSKRSGLILFAALAALFLAANQGAYRGYFQDDDFDSLAWTPYGSAGDYLKGVLTPKFFPNNFRPVGHFYYHEAEYLFGLDFPKWVAVLHGFHLLNVWLVWLLARRLGANAFSAAAGCLFFALHMALFDVLWKPAYCFDLLCATFCLTSLLLYARGRWILSLVSFWLAYKAKEIAVMLPVALVCYEAWFGGRRWKSLVPFFLISLSFGIQGLLMNPNQDNEYTFRFTFAALARTSLFYAARVCLVPYLGLALPLAAVMARNRRTWFGLAAMAAFFVPVLFLPSHMFSAYCYLPFACLAIALSGISEAAHPAYTAAFLLLLIPRDVHAFRLQRRETLAQASEVREWVTTLAAFARSGEHVDQFVCDGAPAGFRPWGVEGAIKYLYRRTNVKVGRVTDPGTTGGRVALLRWDAAERRLHIETVQ